MEDQVVDPAEGVSPHRASSMTKDSARKAVWLVTLAVCALIVARAYDHLLYYCHGESLLCFAQSSVSYILEVFAVVALAVAVLIYNEQRKT